MYFGVFWTYFMLFWSNFRLLCLLWALWATFGVFWSYFNIFSIFCCTFNVFHAKKKNIQQPMAAQVMCLGWGGQIKTFENLTSRSKSNQIKLTTFERLRFLARCEVASVWSRRIGGRSTLKLHRDHELPRGWVGSFLHLRIGARWGEEDQGDAWGAHSKKPVFCRG